MKSSYSTTLHTSRLTLTQLSLPDDLPFCYTLFENALKGDSSPYTTSTVLDFFNRTAKRHAQAAPAGPAAASYIVRLSSTNEPVGAVFFYVRKAELPGELGIEFLGEFQRKGYGTEALKEVVSELTRNGVTDLSALTREKNEACQGMLRKAGFLRKGTVVMKSVDRDGVIGEGTELLGFVLPGMKGFNGEEVWSNSS